METKPGVDLPASRNQLLASTGGGYFLPIVAVLGGMWAFRAAPDSSDLTTLVAALVMVVGGWTPLWHTATAMKWSAPLASWRTWDRKAALLPWPYLQPDTPGAAIHDALRRATAWWRAVGRDALAIPLRIAVQAWIVSVLAGLILGRAALLLTLALAAWTQVAVLWHEGRGEIGPGWAAGAVVGLPWLLGAVLVASDITMPVVSALALFVLMGFYAIPSPVAGIGPIATAAFLIWQGHFVPAGVLMALSIPPLMVLLNRPSAEDYRRAVTPWLAAMVALMAWTL